ncbi:MAG: Gfo/Idh/MocA family oxidoreductase [Alphaproteobacteria bacterium]|nr:Gfo/Idh/MocA family oxidoreductase [Alphaproteobacteria bacterium]
MVKNINIGVIGAGYMGKAHSLALHAVGATFNTNLRPTPYMICTTTAEGAERKRQELGFVKATHRWQEMVADDNIDAIIIASPQDTHKEIALASLQAGKHVFCEKPLTTHIDDSRMLAEKAKQSKLVNMVGFNYIQTPAVQMARKMIADGVLGDINFMRGEHTEDFLADPNIPANWRTESLTSGTLYDLSPHMINCALAMLGDITELVADIATIYPTRPNADNPAMMEKVHNDDQAHLLCRFKTGAMGNLYFSRVATGQKMGYRFEIYGSKGAVKFEQEDQNALWYYDMSRADEYQGFTKILMSAPHPDFAALCPGDGHGTGYGEQIVIEMRNFLAAITDGSHHWPSFADGLQVDEIVHAAALSHQQKKWIKIENGDT